MRLSPTVLTIAARKSDLARIQAYMVGDALQSNFPGLQITYRFSSSLGDRNQDDPLWEMPEQGVFTQDFVRQLAEGQVDMVVHSWKDLPTGENGLTRLVATLPRADHRDLLLVTRDGVRRAMASRTLHVLSSSPRRCHNLLEFLPRAFPGGLEKIVFEPVRGNIQTRIDKLLGLSAQGHGKGETIDGLVVAKAAIDRLLDAGRWSREGDDFSNSVKTLRAAIDQCRWMVLPASHNPPAAAQGALVVETAAGRDDLVEMLDAINSRSTFDDVSHERSILASHGGGCHQKIGVWVKTLPGGRITSLRGKTHGGKVLQEFSMEPAGEMPEHIGRDEIFLPSRYASMFRRQPVFASSVDLEKISEAKAVFLASSHIPNEYLSILDGQVVWASGVASWFRFASKHIWVNGVDDNLGSLEPRCLDVLLDGEPDWLTLSHDKSPVTNRISTYRLLPDTDELAIDGEKYFYWRSGTAFKRALELQPLIAGGIHCCGPGRTLDAIREVLGADARILTFAGEQDWLEQMKKRQRTEKTDK